MTLEHLRQVLQREIRLKTPQAIELRLPGEVILISATVDAVINELLVRDAQEVELVKCDATYLVEQEFLYVLTVDII